MHACHASRFTFHTSHILAVVVIIALASCSRPGPSPTPESGDAFDFRIIAYQGGDLLGGQVVKLSDVLAQGKPVVLNLWAGLCPVCRVEMPALQQVHEVYGDRVLIVGVDVGVFSGLGTEDDARALLAEQGITFPAGTTRDDLIMREYQVVGIPALYFVTPDGQIIFHHYGALAEEELGQRIELLLKSSEG